MACERRKSNTSSHCSTTMFSMSSGCQASLQQSGCIKTFLASYILHWWKNLKGRLRFVSCGQCFQLGICAWCKRLLITGWLQETWRIKPCTQIKISLYGRKMHSKCVWQVVSVISLITESEPPVWYDVWQWTQLTTLQCNHTHDMWYERLTWKSFAFRKKN